MCHIPVFCWISATVLEKMLSEAESGDIPKTLSQMYTHFLILQTNIKHEKDYEKTVKDEDMILKLGKVAFQQLVKGNVIFYEEDLRECDIDVTEALVYSGLCSQIFREEFGLYQGKVFCFVHLSVQEHLAALYVHLSCINNNTNVFDPSTKQRPLSKVLNWFQNNLLSELHERAVDEALQNKNGHLDLFLRFLLGLSVESHQNLLQGLMTQTRSSSDSNKKTAVYIKKKIRTIDSPEKFINLFHCLNELGDHSLVEEIQQYLKSGTIKGAKLSSSQWSAVAFVLLTSEKKLDEFDINKFVEGNNETEKLEVFQKLLPVIKESRSVQLRCCGVTDEGCAALASALRSNPSHLRDLDLSGNKIKDSALTSLSAVLEDPHCKLEKLTCWIYSLSTGPLPSWAEVSFCQAEYCICAEWIPICAECILLSYCGVTDEGCAALASALRSNPSHLRVLDLSLNKIGNLLSLLSAQWFGGLMVRESCCASLASALRSNPSHLRQLNLSGNIVGNSVNLLSAVLKNPHCKLEKLWLMYCGVTDEGCAALASALKSNPSHMRELDLTGNKLGSSSTEECVIVLYRLSDCGVTDDGCAALASALRSNPSHLRVLNLSGNKLQDSSMKFLSAVLEDPHCKLEKLELCYCGVTDEGCAALASALRSNPSHLRVLDLTGNKVGQSEVKFLSDLKGDPHYKLEELYYCEYVFI
uniref:NACHT LRR and PYD domain-containing protein n=1 Tax=Sinocyclocheilus anshuiensis TaxID=1608454 RepID=A0A671RN80_9TELE